MGFKIGGGPEGGYASPPEPPQEPEAEQPTSPPAPPVNPKKVILGIVASIVGAIGLGALITALVLWLTADMRDRTHLFLGHVRNRRDDLAYAMMTHRMRGTVPASEVSSYLDRTVPNSRRSNGEWINGSSGGLTRECMEVWLEGAEGTVWVILEKEGELWMVDAVAENEPSECDTD